MIWLLPLLLIAACGFAARPALRRFSAAGLARTGAIDGEAEFDLRDWPEPPLLQAASAQLLDRGEVFRRLRQLELGVSGAARSRSR